MNDIRTDRLTRLIDERFDGVQSAAAQGLGISTGYLNDLLHGRVSFGEKAARKIESAAGLAPGWLDKQRGSAGTADTIEVVVNGRVAMTLPAGAAVTLRLKRA